MISWILNIYAKLNWIDFASISKVSDSNFKFLEFTSFNGSHYKPDVKYTELMIYTKPDKICPSKDNDSKISKNQF